MQRPYVLWRQSKAQQDALAIDVSDLPPYVLITSWISPSQRSALCHPRVTLFVTHGGINSPQEAIDCGKPLIVVPSFGDQAGHAARLEANGIAINMVKAQFSASKFWDAFETMLNSIDNYNKRVDRAQRLLRATGGTPKAAVEGILEYGYAHLQPADLQLSFLQKEFMLDIVVGYFLVGLALVLAMGSFARCLGGLFTRKNQANVSSSHRKQD